MASSPSPNLLPRALPINLTDVLSSTSRTPRMTSNICCSLVRGRDGVDSYLQHDRQIPFSVLAALARLGHKYQLDDVVAGACGRLASVFCVHFRKWTSTREIGNMLVSFQQGNAIEAVNLFRLLGRTNMLPTAMYQCCQLPISALLQGVQRADRTLEKLNAEDLERCLAARESLTAGYAWMSLTFLDVPPSNTCVSPVDCMGCFEDMRQGPISGPDLCQGTDVLSYSFSYLAKSMAEDGSICKMCLDKLLARHSAMREKIWRQLPSLMKLEDVDSPP